MFFTLGVVVSVLLFLAMGIARGFLRLLECWLRMLFSWVRYLWVVVWFGVLLLRLWILLLCALVLGVGAGELGEFLR